MVYGNRETDARVALGLPGLAVVVLNGDRVPSTRKVDSIEFTVPRGCSGVLEFMPTP